MNIDKFTMCQGDTGVQGERTLGFMGELKQVLVPRLKRTPPGCRELRTEPNGSELGLKSPPRGSLPHNMELLFEGEVLHAPPPDEIIDGIKGILIPCFEPFGVV